MVWIQIRTDVLLVLMWVLTVCKGYQQMTKVTASTERVKIHVQQSVDVDVSRQAFQAIFVK